MPRGVSLVVRFCVTLQECRMNTPYTHQHLSVVKKTPTLSNNTILHESVSLFDALAILQNEITVESGGGGRGRPGEGESEGSGGADCLGTSPVEVMLG